jgi:hypothetical protein
VSGGVGKVVVLLFLTSPFTCKRKRLRDAIPGLLPSLTAKCKRVRYLVSLEFPQLATVTSVSVGVKLHFTSWWGR